MDESEEREANILVVEDEEHLATGLKLNLELEGFRVAVARNGREARQQLIQPEQFHIIIFDVMLPDTDGFTLCRHLRNAGVYVPVLMLTAKHSPKDRVAGLDAGADDYLTKPFELSELLARVRSLLRRQHWDRSHLDIDGDAECFSFGDVHLNFTSHEARVGERPVQLTQLEFDLMRYFAKNQGRVLSRTELLEKVWKLKNYPNTRTVDNFIVRLRKHFEADPQKPAYFRSIRGAGYKFVVQKS